MGSSPSVAGTLTAVEEHLNPVLISSGSDEAELLVVQILVGRHKVRVVNGYGPQENDTKEKIYAFWQEFEKEIIDAKEENCLIVAELDANAKLGREIIKEDPNPISLRHSYFLFLLSLLSFLHCP